MSVWLLKQSGLEEFKLGSQKRTFCTQPVPGCAVYNKINRMISAAARQQQAQPPTRAGAEAICGQWPQKQGTGVCTRHSRDAFLVLGVQFAVSRWRVKGVVGIFLWSLITTEALPRKQAPVCILLLWLRLELFSLFECFCDRMTAIILTKLQRPRLR